MASKRQTVNKEISRSKPETKPDQLVKYVKTISEKVSGIAKSQTKTNSKKIFADFAKIISEQLTKKLYGRVTGVSTKPSRTTKLESTISGDNLRHRRNTSGQSPKNVNFETEVIRLLNRIDTATRKNDVPDFLEKHLVDILHQSHIKNVVWDENRADNRTSPQSKSNQEILDVIKGIQSSSVTLNKSINNKSEIDDEQDTNNGENTKSKGGTFSKVIKGITGLTIGGIMALVSGTFMGAGAIYHATGGDKPTLGQSTARTGIKAGLKYGARKLTKLAPKLSTKRFGVLRQLAKDPATKIIRGTVKNVTKMLPKGGRLGKVATSIKPALTRVAKLAGIRKAAQKVGVKGLLKAGKLAKSAKWLGKAGKIAKFGGKKLIPGVGLVLGGMEAMGHVREGNYLRAAMSLGSGVLSTIPGVGTAASLGLDALGLAGDVGGWAAKKRVEIDKKKREAKARGQKPQLTFGEKFAGGLANMSAGNILPKSWRKTQAGRTANEILDLGLRFTSPVHNMMRNGYDFTESKMHREEMAKKKEKTQQSVTTPSVITKPSNISTVNTSITSGPKTTKPTETRRNMDNKPANPRFGRPTSRPQTHQTGKPANPRFGRPTSHSQTPRVTRPESKPKMEKPQILQNPKRDNLNSTITDEMKKNRDASEAQSKQITQSFKEELDRVCLALAQINATLPSLQPIAPPPVQKVMGGNKVPEFRKHNLEAIA